MTLSVIYLLVLVPVVAVILSGCAVASTQRSAERVREIERRRSAG